MGLFDDIFAPYRQQPPAAEDPFGFDDIFSPYRTGPPAPEDPIARRRRELEEQRLGGNAQWDQIQGGMASSPDSTLGAVGTGFANTALDLGRGVVQTGTNLEEGLGGLMQGAGEQFGMEGLAGAGQGLGARARRTNDLLADPIPREESTIRDIAQSGLANLPQLGMVALTGGAALPLLGVQAGGQEYSQARELGASPEAAGTAATGVAAVEMLTEQFGDVRLVKRMLGQVAAAKSVEQGIKRFLGDMALNGGEELAADIGGRISRAASYSETQFGPGWFNESLKAAASGMLAPVAANLSTAPGELARNKALETAQMNRAFAQGVQPEGGLFRDIFQTAAANNPMEQAGPPAPQMGPPSPLDRTREGAARFRERPEIEQMAARLSAADNEFTRRQELERDQADLREQIENPRRPSTAEESAGVFSDAMDSKDRWFAEQGIPPTGTEGQETALSGLEDLNAGIEVAPAPLKSSKKMSKEELRQAYLTSKTGVANENAFLERQAERPHRRIIAVDLDDFGQKNKVWGHAVGDELLNVQARAFQAAGFDGNYHIHGDEFLLGHDGDDKDMGSKLDKARQYAEQNPVIVEKDGQRIAISVSFGHGIGHDRQSADLALTKSKAAAKEERRRLARGDAGGVSQAAGLEKVQGREEGAFGVIEPKSAVSADAIAWATGGHPTARAPVKAKSSFEPIPANRKPTAWKAAKSGDEPYWWDAVEGVGAVHEASDGSFLLLGMPDKGKRLANGWGEPQNKSDEGPEGISVQRTIEAHRAHFAEQMKSGWVRPVAAIGISGTGHQALIGLDTGGAIPARVWDYLQRKMPEGAELMSRRGMPNVYVVKDGEAVGWAKVTQIDPKATVMDEPDTQDPQAFSGEREPGDDAPDPEDPYTRAPSNIEEDLSDLPEALRAVAPGIKAPDPGALKNFFNKWIASKQGLSTAVRDTREKREGGVAFGHLLNQNVGNAIRVMSRKYLSTHPNVDPNTFREAIRDVLRGQTPAAGAPKIPPVLRSLVERGREIIDNLSKKNIEQLRKDGNKEGLADVMEGNLGTYLNRAYATFDDPKHVEKLKESGRWNDLKARVAQLPEHAGKSDEQIEGFMNNFADRKEDFGAGTAWGLGTVETEIYKKRKEIPLVLRELLGEYTDPAVEFFQTAEKLTRNVATMEMYSALEEIGKKEGWLSDEPIGEVFHEISGKAQRTPVGGKFTTKDMKEIIEGVVEQSGRSWLKFFTGIIKINKTVGSAQGQARNIESNPGILLAGGNLGAKWMPWGRKSDQVLGYGRAIGEEAEFRSGARLAQKAAKGLIDNMSDEELLGAWGRGAKLGIAHGGSIDLADIRAFLGESNKLSSPSDPAGATWHAAKKLYRLGDDIPRFVGWQSEVAKILWHSPDTTLEAAEHEAANITKDIMPTEGRQGRWLREFRKKPLVGGFVSFVSEIPRNATNIAERGLKEIRDGHRDGNKRKMAVGAHRLASLTAAMSAPSVLASLVAAAFRGGDDEREDEEVQKAVRTMAPPWMKNSQIATFKIGGGKAFVLDLSFMDPWAVVKKPILAYTRNRDKPNVTRMQAALAALRAAAEPYATEGLGVMVIEDLVRNQDRYGRFIIDPDAPADVQLEKKLSYLYKAVEPGTLTSLRRIKKAATGEVEESGRSYSLWAEVAALLGPRFMTLDGKQGLKSAGQAYLDGQRRATAALNKIESREGNVTQKEIDDARETADNAWERGARALAEAVEAAEVFGLTRAEMIRALGEGEPGGKKGAGMSKKDIGAALSSFSELEKQRVRKAKTRAEQDRLLKGK